MNIVVLGPQGSGKTTQAKLIARHLALPLLDVGSLLRRESQKETERAKGVAQAVSSGSLIADELLVEILTAELKDGKYTNGVVLDGAPRTLVQAQLTGEILSVDRVISLAVADATARRRLLGRARSDDTQEVIDRRLRTYHTLTEPVLAYYRRLGILEEVDGQRSVEEIFEDIKSRIRQ